MAIDHGYMAEEALRDLLVWDLLVRWDLLDLLVLSNPIGYVGSSRQIQPAPQDLPVLADLLAILQAKIRRSRSPF